MTVVKVRKIGNSLGFVLRKEILAKLGVSCGDELFLIETQSGYEITPCAPKFVEQVSAAQRIMKQRRNMLRKLAE
jgi:putative addiction module antidote